MKRIQWVASSKKDLERIAREVRLEIRAALFAAQNGQTVGSVKRMRDDLRDVMEVAVNGIGGTSRGMYYAGTESIYALHFFQKKSKRGGATPKRELDLIRHRLAWSRRQEGEAG